MSNLQILTAVRGHLLNQEVAPRVHLALPPKAIYPLVLIELEEIWSPYLLKDSGKRKAIQARVKFKVSILSNSPGVEEGALLSDKVRRALEGVTLRLPDSFLAERSATIRFLACVAETLGNREGGQRARATHHFYDSIVRG